ncbi:MAG: hypothetical protein ACYTAN_08145 [Planctomycetota bacterium]|jgi:hypothetical protein
MDKKTLKRTKARAVEYLLAPRRPAWVKYRTLVDICGRPANDPEVAEVRGKRDASAVVAGIRARQARDGTFRCMPWLHIHRYYFQRMLEMGYGTEDAVVRRSARQLLDYQLPDGAYMHPHATFANPSQSRAGWAPCVSGYVTKALMDLGFRRDKRVRRSLQVMLERQRDNGGWICRHVGQRAPYCILSGTPWVFSCLAHAGLVDKSDRIVRRAVAVFDHHKEKIIRHGYHRDHYYRCDEALLIPALVAAGFTPRSRLLGDFAKALAKKQQANGAWAFRGKTSPWYTIECILALGSASHA